MSDDRPAGASSASIPRPPQARPIGSATLTDRRSLSRRISEEIRRTLIRDLSPGERAPTEAELAEIYGVARTTVREAFKLLEQDGTLRVRHGVGRFMSVIAVERPITRLESVTEMTAALGVDITNRVLAVGQKEATEEEAAALQVRPGDPVIRLERIRLHGVEPLIYSIDVLPRALIPVPLEELDWGGSLADLLASFGHRLESAAAHIRAVAAPAAVAAITGRRHDPWLALIQINVDSNGDVITYSHDYHHGEMFTFDVLRRSEPGSPR